MKKKDEIERGCMAKAAADEPVFVLRAQDKLAVPLVRMWAELAKLHGLPSKKFREAYALAEDMEAWPTRKFPD